LPLRPSSDARFALPCEIELDARTFPSESHPQFLAGLAVGPQKPESDRNRTGRFYWVKNDGRPGGHAVPGHPPHALRDVSKGPGDMTRLNVFLSEQHQNMYLNGRKSTARTAQ
jgi:hypothetical protein